MSKNIELRCPVCDHPSQQELETYINTRENSQAVADLKNNKLFLFECDQCGAKRQLESQFVYHNPDKNYLLINYPGLYQNQEQALARGQVILKEKISDPRSYQLRLVPSLAYLVEKIQIFEDDLDDRIVEIVKLLTDGLLAKEKQDAQVQGRFFYKQGDQRKILYLLSDDQVLVDFNQSLMDFAIDKFKKATTATVKGQWQVIDQAYAEQLLSK
ncbi:CpXC domain-containing protein [Eremococcus coleocola]|uniref:CpXC domain-containing protein n=1 Tax=Eremococcus coleocola TaxID=88132 RepID=UPI0004235779|nr:CpXC domain-containing protein [Eremococcus coleocola]